jgi:hypothetical protein
MAKHSAYLQRRPRRGIMVLYLAVLMSVLIGFTSLGVDWAEVQLAKTQLLAASDAASRAAAANISNGVTAAQNAAVLYGGYNAVAGTAFVVNPTDDIDFGTWSTSSKTFTVLTGSARSGANAIRVWGRRTTPNGNPVKLTFGPLIGASTIDMQVQSIAYLPPGTGTFGLVGLNSANMTGNSTTDSYNAASGPYSSSSAGMSGFVASNGNMNITGNTTIKNNIYMQAGQGLSASGSASYGTRETLSSTLVWPTPSAGSYASSNNNSSIGMPTNGANLNWSSGTLNIPSGNYYLNTFNISGGTVNISSGVTLYMNGNFGLSGGTINTSGNLPANFEVKMVTAAGVNISGNSSLYADIQAPTSPINISGGSTIYGRLIGSSLSISGNTSIHVDTSLPTVTGASSPPAGSGGGSGSGAIQLVK